MNHDKLVLLEKELNDLKKEIEDSLSILRKLVSSITGDGDED